MQLSDIDRLSIATIILPAFAVAPLLFSPLPLTEGVDAHTAREIAGYFQALAFLETGLDSFTFLTPGESFSALHLHSLLTTPLLALGYTEGGRLISLIGGIVSAALLYQLAHYFVDRQIAVLTPALLWIHPLFVRSSARWWPDTISIAFTLAALYAAFRYCDSHQRLWYLGTLLAVSLAITNHMWEATIALPLVALFAYERDWLEAAGVVLTTGTTIVFVWLATHLQPAGASSLTHYAVWNNPMILLSPDWWIFIKGVASHPIVYSQTLTLPIGLVGLAWASVQVYQTRGRRYVVLTAWLVSGAAIPLLLPMGFDAHVYYLWGLLAPIAVLGTDVLNRIAHRVAVNRETAVRHLTVVVVIVACLSGLMFEVGVFADSDIPAVNEVGDGLEPNAGVGYGEATAAGKAIRSASVRNPNGIVFVGDWGQDPDASFQKLPAATRTIIYSGVLPRARSLSYEVPDTPRFVTNESQVKQCAVMVTKSNETVTVHKC
jgi:hypothetical protein